MACDVALFCCWIGEGAGSLLLDGEGTMEGLSKPVDSGGALGSQPTRAGNRVPRRGLYGFPLGAAKSHAQSMQSH